MAQYSAGTELAAYTGLEDDGIITTAGDENESEAKMAQIRELAKAHNVGRLQQYIDINIEECYNNSKIIRFLARVARYIDNAKFLALHHY